MIITDAIKALQVGQELKDPAKWKAGQDLTNKVYVVLIFAVGLIRTQVDDLQVTDAQLLAIAGAIGAILAVINSFLTNATTKKIGIKPKV